MPGTTACGAVEAVAIVSTPSGLGYAVQLADGRAFSFGDAPDVSPAPLPAGVRIVDLTIMRP